jgi:hypothetical protein
MLATLVTEVALKKYVIRTRCLLCSNIQTTNNAV